MRGGVITFRTALAFVIGILLIILIQHIWPSQTAFVTKDYTQQKSIIGTNPNYKPDGINPTSTPLDEQQAPPQDVKTTPVPSNGSGVWGPAGAAPVSMSGASPLYIPGTQTIMGWVVQKGPVSLPSGVCVDFDPRSTTVTGSFDTIIDNDSARRVRMTSSGQYEGAYPATIYWTPC